LYISCRMLGANIFTAVENEVLYVWVTLLLHSNERESKMDFIGRKGNN